MTEQLATAQRRTGRSIELALTAGQNSPERLPGLLSVLGQLPKEFGEEAKSIAYLQPRIRLVDVIAATYAEASGRMACAVIGSVWAEKWRQRVYFQADEMLTALFLEIAAGGETAPADPPLGRPIVAAECTVVEVLFRRLARALTNAFSIVVDVTFEVSAVGEKLDVEHVCKPSAPVICARLSVEWLGQVGTIAVIIPLVALESVRAILTSAPVAEASGEDGEPVSDWTRQLAEEIARAFVSVHAVLEERPILLSEVHRFAVGQVIELTCPSISSVRLDAEERPVFWCELGKSAGSLLLRIDKEFDPDDMPGEAI